MIKLATPKSDKLVEVRPLKRLKFLAIHASVDYEEHYDITHLPTGFRVVSCDGLDNAKKFLERIKDFNWDFKTPEDKPAGLSEQMKDAFAKFRTEFGYYSVRMR